MRNNTMRWLVTFSLFWGGLLPLSSVLAAPPPNMVVIYVDDLDNTQLGILGNKNLMTPQIDQLARDGMIFNQGFVTSTVCTPSRFGVLTGQYASRSIPLQTIKTSSWRNRNYPPGGPGNIHFNAILAPGQKTIGNYLKDLGYKTGLVGKWHVGMGAEGYASKKKLQLKGIAPDSPEGQEKISQYYQESIAYVKDNYGFDFVDGFYIHNARNLKGLGYPEEYSDHNPEWMAAKAREFIEANKQKPFFLYYATTLPHGETGRTAKSIENTDPLLTPAGRLRELPNSGMPSRQSVLDRIKKANLPTTSAGMLWVDDSIGTVLDKLEEAGVADNTVVFFISDHGDRGKSSLYDSGVRVPYFVKWPGVLAPNSTSDQIVANIDVAPTLLDIAGKPTADTFDGKSILPILKGSDAPVREGLLLELGYGRGVVTKDWKYIALRFPDFELPEIEKQGGLKNVNYNADSAGKAWRDRGMRNYPGYYDFDQLYDRNKDPKEQINLYSNPEYSSRVEEMKILLAEEIKTKPHTFAEFSE